VHPRVAALLFAAAPGRIALITDAMAAAGGEDGDYLLGGLTVEVRGGRAMLAGGDTLAGSTLTLDAALRTGIAAGLQLPVVVEALTLTPARALGLESRFGLLEAGYAGDVVLFEEDWSVSAVFAAGKRVD
jgi:N-acetylglucosamine-6-phosphate deacetylase